MCILPFSLTERFRVTSPLALREPTSDQRPPLNQTCLAVRGQSPAHSLYSFVGETTVHLVSFSFFCDTVHQRAQLTLSGYKLSQPPTAAGTRP